MEGTELQPADLHKFTTFPLWIIEHVWAHRMMDLHEVVDLSGLPEMDSQPLSLEDSCRLRVASAQAFSIIQNRNVEHFERVISFLEATYRLLPRLVTPIKHMKIMFGLKTLVIMWMLRDGRGMVDTVFKTCQFFPSKLPQYQDQCSQHEMFLMRKNHLDFKALAQTLAMNKDKLEDYIKTQMEEQYGEHYAQRVEDRLLHYLQELETVLPGDTHIDKILKKQSPANEEEKLLLKVITSDFRNIATTLKKLLHYDVASCRPRYISQSSARGENGMENSKLSKSVLYSGSSKPLLKSMEAETPPQLQPEVFQEGEEVDQNVSEDSSIILEKDSDSDVSRPTEEDGEVVKRVEEDISDREKDGTTQGNSECVQEAALSPQFCSKHQRWVKTILQECPDECSEELLLQSNVSSSPLLFQSSSSATSSQDLTPSNLIPGLPDHQHLPSQISTLLQSAAHQSEQANPEDEHSSGSASDMSQKKLPPQPSSSRDTLLPALLSPVVRLIDIASIKGFYPASNPKQTPLNHFTRLSKKQAASTSSPQALSSPHRHTSDTNNILRRTQNNPAYHQQDALVPTDPANTTNEVQTAHLSQDASTSNSCQPVTLQSLSKLSRKFTQDCTSTRNSQVLNRFSQKPSTEQFEKSPANFWTDCPLFPNFSVSRPSTQHASTSSSQSGTLSAVFAANQVLSFTDSSRQVSPQNSIQPHPHTNVTPLQSQTLTCSTVVSSTSNSDCLAVKCETSGVQRVQLRLSLRSQAVLLQSKLLQPYVTLTRLSAQKCHRVTKWRSSISYVEPVVQGSSDGNDEDGREEEEEQDADSSFDLNTVYFSHSSSSDSEDSLVSDPDYKPCINKKRLLLEYEAAKSLNHS